MSIKKQFCYISLSVLLSITLFSCIDEKDHPNIVISNHKGENDTISILQGINNNTKIILDSSGCIIKIVISDSVKRIELCFYTNGRLKNYMERTGKHEIINDMLELDEGGNVYSLKTFTIYDSSMCINNSYSFDNSGFISSKYSHAVYVEYLCPDIDKNECFASIHIMDNNCGDFMFVSGCFDENMKELPDCEMDTFYEEDNTIIVPMDASSKITFLYGFVMPVNYKESSCMYIILRDTIYH